MIRTTSLFTFAILIGAIICGVALTVRQREIAALRVEHRQIITQIHDLTREKNEISRQSLRSEPPATSSDLVRRASLAAVEIIKRQPAPSVQPSELPSPSGPRANRIFAELLEDPEYVRLCRTVFTQQVDERYGAVLTGLQSEPHKAAALKQRLIERYFVDLEAEHIAMQNGLSSTTPEIRYRVREELEDEIRTLIGPELYAKVM